MQHKWDEGEMFMGDIVSMCTVCGGTRIRSRTEGVDYINTGAISIDMVGRTRKGWRYGETPRSCPGRPAPTVQMTDERIAALKMVLEYAQNGDSWHTLHEMEGAVAIVSAMLQEIGGGADGAQND